MERVIHVEWSGSYSYSEVINNSLKDDFTVKPSDSGLYQIYGNHPVYGNDVLIYIGKTNQNFLKRLKGRSVIMDNADFSNVKIYLGKIFYDNCEHNSSIDEDISKAESLLIHFHKPSNNSSNINSFKCFDENITVINIGHYRSLQKCISTKSFTKEIEIYDYITQFAKELKLDIYEEEDGYGFWVNDDVWFGVDYELWGSDVVLVLESESEDKLLRLTEPIRKDEKLFFEPIHGEKKEILNLLKELS